MELQKHYFWILNWHSTINCPKEFEPDHECIEHVCLARCLLFAKTYVNEEKWNQWCQQRFAHNLVCFCFISSPQWSTASAQIQSGEFFRHCSPLVRATAAAGWPYPRLLSVLPESGWSRKPTEPTTPPWSQILWILGFLGKHFMLEFPKKVAFDEEKPAIAFPVSNFREFI